MKNSTISAILSFCIPGIGQIYNGDWLRGIAWLIVTGVSWIGSVGGFGLPLILHFVCAFTAHHRARQINEFRSYQY